MNYIFFDSKWRLHDGELPVKPDNLQRGLSGIELLAYALAMEDYDQAIADIKANALEIDNPEILQVKEFLGHRKLLIGDEYFPVYDGKFYQWPGSYEKKSNQASRGVFKEVAHLVLPPEEKNMKTEPIAIFNPKNIAADDYFIKMSNALGEVEDEISRAKQLFPSMFINQHEAIAVIREEYLELEQECFKNQRNYNLAAQRKEAKQLAAMAIRLMIELT